MCGFRPSFDPKPATPAPRILRVGRMFDQSLAANSNQVCSIHSGILQYFTRVLHSARFDGTHGFDINTHMFNIITPEFNITCFT